MSFHNSSDPSFFPSVLFLSVSLLSSMVGFFMSFCFLRRIVPSQFVGSCFLC